MGNEELEKEDEETGGEKKRKKQVNVITDKNDEISRDKYIKKISMIEKEIELNKSRDKIFKKTASMFDKKLRNLDELSAIADSKLDTLINRMFKMHLEKRKENRIHNINPQDKLIIEQSIKQKSEQTMIKLLSNENKKLKEENQNLNKKLINSEDFSRFDKIGIKNIEIHELKKKNAELTKKYEEAKNLNTALITKNEQLEEIIIRFKRKYLELRSEKIERMEKSETIRNNSFKMELKKNKKNINLKKDNKNINNINNKNTNNNKLLRSTSVMYFKGIRKNKPIREIIGDSFFHLLNDKERASLRNLFSTDEEFLNFSNKLDIVETRNKRVEMNLEKKISNLNKILIEQNKENENLKKEIEFRDKKIRFLETQLNELKEKNKNINIKLISNNNNNKRNLSTEKQLNSDINNKRKRKADILINKCKEELNQNYKNYIEKIKEKEINKINKEIGDIYFLDTKFFEKFNKKNNDTNHETK